MGNLPSFLNGDIQWLYDGKRLPIISEEDHLKLIDEIDPLWRLREEFEKKFKKEIADQYNIFTHEFKTLHEVEKCISTIQVQNITLMLLYERLCKSLSITICDIVDKTIKMIDLLNSKYFDLFKNSPLEKIIELIAISDVLKRNLYVDVLNKHSQISEKFFRYGFNSKKNPRGDNFKEIKNELCEKRKILKDYRDSVAGHVDHGKDVYLPKWEELNEFMNYFDDLIFKIYFLTTYGNTPLELTGSGLKISKTVEWFCEGLKL